jgi:hypothetical protein
MAERTPQNFQNHTRFDPIFHFFLLPLLGISVIAALVHLIMRPGAHSALALVFAIVLFLMLGISRGYSLKVQDRVIRLEERLRLATLLAPELRPRIPELKLQQLVALRFASDAELPALATRALNEKLAPKEIKKAVQQWRPDYLRV